MGISVLVLRRLKAHWGIWWGCGKLRKEKGVIRFLLIFVRWKYTERANEVVGSWERKRRYQALVWQYCSVESIQRGLTKMEKATQGKIGDTEPCKVNTKPSLVIYWTNNWTTTSKSTTLPFNQQTFKPHRDHSPPPPQKLFICPLLPADWPFDAAWLSPIINLSPVKILLPPSLPHKAKRCWRHPLFTAAIPSPLSCVITRARHGCPLIKPYQEAATLPSLASDHGGRNMIVPLITTPRRAKFR